MASGGATRIASLRWKCSKTQQSVAELREILRMVTVEMVINSTCVMGIHMTMSSRYCIDFDVMVVLDIF